MYSIRAVDLPSVSPEANGASDEKGISVKISQIFARVSLFFKEMQFNFKYLNCKIDLSLGGADRRRVFNKDKIVAKSGNNGRRGDIGKFLHPVAADQLKKTAETHHVTMIDESSFYLKPFSDGVCYGDSLLFSRRVLETGDVRSVANEFEGGAPYDAVLLHGHYDRLIDNMRNNPKFPSNANEQRMCFAFAEERELCSFEEDKYVLATDKGHIDKHLKEFNLSDNPLARIWCITSSGLATQKIKPEAPLPQFIQQAPLEYRNFDQVRKSEEITQEIAGLASSTTLMKNFSRPEVLEAVPSWENGVFRFTLPNYSSRGKLEGHHTVVLVKEEGKSYLFDANLGVGWEDSDGQDLMDRLFTYYCGKLCPPGQQRSMWSEVGSFVSNFLNGRSNPPLFGEVENSFTVQQMKLSPAQAAG